MDEANVPHPSHNVIPKNFFGLTKKGKFQQMFWDAATSPRYRLSSDALLTSRLHKGVRDRQKLMIVTKYLMLATDMLRQVA
jgi:hypothetical protein